MKKRFVEIDCLRGLAISLVLLGHSIIMFPINLNNIFWCQALHFAVSSVHLPLFFAVAGFCFHFRGYRDLLNKKTPRLVIPYLVFSLAGIAAPLFFPSLVNEPKPLGEMLLGILTGQTAWFLYALFLIFLLFPVLLRLARNRTGAWITAILILLIYFFPYWPKVCNLANVADYLLFFALGYAVRQRLDMLGRTLEKAEKKLGRFVLWTLCVVLWACLVGLMMKIGEKNRLPYSVPRLFAALLGMFLCLEYVRYRVSGPVCRAFAEIGKYTLQLYLFNGYFLVASRTLLVKILGITAPIPVILGNYIVILGLNYLFVKYVIARVKLFRTLTGMV